MYCKSKIKVVSCKSLANHQESASGMSDDQGIISEDNLQASIACIVMFVIMVVRLPRVALCSTNYVTF